MSLLINGMEMPKSCDLCPIMMFEDTNCVNELYCGCQIVFKAHPQGVDHRPDYCPLIEIPPHGDLIDRNTLMQHEVLLPKDGGHMPVVYASYIRNASTIISAEEGE